MTRWVLIVEGGYAGVNSLAGRVAGVVYSEAGPHLPGSHGRGDATWDLVTESDSVPAAPVDVCDRVALAPVAWRLDPFDGPRIKRTLLVRVHPGTSDEVVSRFEASLAAMPDHIGAIRSWALSRVDPARSTGGWTHAWEQEFADLDGLRLDYMRHPYHWTGVERWFDPEIPGSIVDTRLAHLIRASDGPVLGPR